MWLHSVDGRVNYLLLHVYLKLLFQQNDSRFCGYNGRVNYLLLHVYLKLLFQR